MSVVLHISDPHFGTEQAAVADALLGLAREQRPDLVVLSGDITQRARRGQFSRAARFVQRLAPPALIALPGNHDIPLYNIVARAFAPYAGYRRAFGPQLEPVFDSEDLLVIAVKTTRRYRHKDGEISQEQINRVCQRLFNGSDKQLKIVVTHHPVLATEEQDVHNIVHNARAAVLAWAQAGAHLILGGHIHLPYLRPLSDAYGTEAGSTWIVQAGTALSDRVRFEAPNSVNMLRHRSEREICCVERYDFVAQRQRFELIAKTEIPLGVPLQAVARPAAYASRASS